jgi:hypothetical protein
MELLLRVNMTKQHDVTTRRCDNDLFDYFDCALKLIGVATVNTGKF